MQTLGMALVLLAAAFEPRLFTLQAWESVNDVIVEDLNVDGRGDLLVLCSHSDARPPEKRILVFMAREDGGFGADPSLVLPLDVDSGAIFLSDTDGVAPRELVISGDHGVDVLEFKGNAFSVRSAHTFHSLLPSRSRTPTFVQELSVDMNGDGVDEWLVPISTGIQVRRGDTVLAELPCDVSSELRTGESLSIRHGLPRIVPFDEPGTDRKGLAFADDEIIEFAHGDNWAQRATVKVPSEDRDEWSVKATLAEFGSGEYPALMINQVKGTINLQVQNTLYQAEGPGVYPATPTAVYSARGALASAMVRDVNGDGMNDLLVFNIPFGIRAITSYFMFRNITVGVQIYNYRDGGIPSEPDVEQRLTIKAPERIEQAAYTLGDFNGDGLLDAALGSGEDALHVHLGEPGRFVTPKASAVIEVPVVGKAPEPVDITGNGNEDIIIFHPRLDNKDKVHVILF
jgi:hypothetical protein